MQRGCLVERLVEAAEHVEQEARHAVRVRPHEDRLQGKGDEAENGDHLRDKITPRQPPHLLRRVANEERKRVEDVDRPVGHDRPGDEGNVPLPAEGEVRHVRAQRGQPVRRAVGKIEERREDGEP